MHIHPAVMTSCSLLMRNKWPAVLRAEGGGQIPTTARSHIPQVAHGDPASQKVQGLLRLDLSFCTEALGSAPPLHPEHSPSCYGAPDLPWAWAGGQPKPESLGGDSRALSCGLHGLG